MFAMNLSLSNAQNPRTAIRHARRSGRRKGERFRLHLETLEARCLLTDFRTITGLGNNFNHPTWGESGTDLLRLSPVAYADGISQPSAPNTLSTRVISNNLNNQSNPIFSGADNLGPPQSKSLSDFAYVWGQFIDHDMDLTPTQSGANAELFNIPADMRTFGKDSNGNPITDPMGLEVFTRSVFDPKTGTSTSNPRQQVNADTSFLDLSQVYGSTDTVADALRTHSGGKLKTSPGDLLPYDTAPYFTPAQSQALNMANDAMQVPESSLFAAGDVRANENMELTALQTLFMRNHNHLAAQLQSLHPSWTDEQLYQEARRLNITEEEIITYNEFLPAILGPNPLPVFTGYNPYVNAGIATEFSTVGFRFGHSLLSNSVGRNNNDGTEIADAPGHPGSGAPVNLTADFFDPNLITASPTIDPLTGLVSSGIGAIIKADADNTANEFDLLLIDEIRNELFGIPNAPGTDLAARDVQRARDDGIGTYNQVRVAFGLPAVTSFAQITSNVSVQKELQGTYGTVDKIDPFEGMLAEDHVSGGDVGPTVKAILANQFTRLRDGDRFFYLNEGFDKEEIQLLAQGSTLAKVIESNTSITNLQRDVFFFKVEISGFVFNDVNGNGVRDAGEPGLAGVTVNLNDAQGNFITSTTTDASGEYDFTDQTGIPGTGNFTLSVVLPTGFTQNSTEIAHNPGTIHLSRGGLAFDNQNFALFQTNTADGNGGVVVTGVVSTSGANTTGASPADQTASSDPSDLVPSPDMTNGTDLPPVAVTTSDVNLNLNVPAPATDADIAALLAQDPALAGITYVA
jgi:hypothetical protein